MQSQGAPFWSNIEFANTYKACRKLGGPFDQTALFQAIGGNVRLYKTQYELFAFSKRLREAQQLKREAILPTENGGYNL